MVIGIDATRANKPHKTGVEWYSYHLIRALAKLETNHTVRLYFRNEPEPGLKNLGPQVEYRILQWPLPYLWTQLRLSWEMFFNPPDLLFIPAQIIPLIHPSRTVTTIHDVAYKPYPKSYTWRSRLYLELAARLARKLPLILTISEFSKREISRYYKVNPRNIIVTPLGFTHDTGTASQLVRAKFQVREPYLFFIGRLERKKNITLLVESFNLIKQETWGERLQLVLAGIKGYGWEEIERVINASPYRQDIKLIGWVNEADRYSLFTYASAFVLVSAYEGFGLPLLEAMHAGTPLVVSDQAALPEVAGDTALIIPRGSVRAIRDAVRDLLVNSELRIRLIRNGKDRVQQFTWKATATKTQDAFSTLLTRV